MHIYSGNPPDINKPLVGDWNGNETDTTGIYNYTTAEFLFDSGLNISFGISGDIPITGDWNGNGYDTIGVFRPSTAQFFLDYDNDGVSDMNATFGVIGDTPVAGDWDGDGGDNIGVFRPNHSDTGLTMFFLDLDNSGGPADQSVAFGEPDDLPAIGDWDGDGDDNIGLYRPGTTTGVFYLDIDNDGGVADIVTPEYGDLGDIPIAGDWDGDSDDNIGVYRPGTGEFFMDATLPDVLPSKTIYVDDDFSDNPSEHRWDTIQEGVNDAADGDTVVVYAGEYVENVDVDKSITLEGEGVDVVTVRAADAGDHVFEVTASWANIRGFTVTGATDRWNAGIYLSGGEHCNISENTVSDNWNGIYLCSSNNNTLQSNTANSNDGGGIHLSDSSDNTLKSNTMSGNTHNFGVDVGFYGYTQNIDTSNTVDGKPIYYWVDQHDRQIPTDAGYVGIVRSTNITIRDLTLTNNSEGVLLVGTSSSRIENVTASNNGYGILLFSSSYNMLKSNMASNNHHGIYLFSSSDNTIQSNTANSNDWSGIYMLYSSDNTLMNNNASNNLYGIHLWQRSNDNNVLTNNTASNNYYGIYLYSSSDNTLKSNTMFGNTYNFGVYGGSLSEYTQNIDTSNTVDGKPIYYWIDQQDKQIIGDAGFVGLVNCTNITVKDLTLTNNTYGVLFAYTENSRIENVNASNNDEGIYLSYSNNNTLIGNTANSNDYGIRLSRSSNNTLQSNTMSGNTYNIDVGDGPSGYTQNIDTSNTVGGKPIYYWVDQQDKQIIGDAGFVGLVNCTNITVEDLTLTNNTYGVLFAYTENSRIENVNTSNRHGIYLKYSNNNTLQSNTANSNTDHGICLWYSNNNTLRGNTVSNNNDGIDLCGSSNNTLTGNTANSNDDCGICLSYIYGTHPYSSSNNTLHGNAVSDNHRGILLSRSSNNMFIGNTMSGNTYNFGLFSSSLFEYIQNIDTSNTVDGKPIYYWVDQQDRQIIGDAGFVGLVNCTNITVKDLTLTNNTYGVLFAYTDNSRIENVTASNNTHYGICLKYSNNNTLTGNTANSNSGFDSGVGIYLCDSDSNTLQSNAANSNADDGIHLWRSSNNTLQGNTANSSGWGDGICLSYSSNNTLHSNIANSNDWCGIRLSSSSNSNTLYHNNLISNTKNAYDDTSTNQWDSGSAGNYYSDYTGTDNNTDGIGEDPYSIPGGTSIDRFPLMHPWSDTPQIGDLNGDDRITPADAVIALAFAAGGSASCDAATLTAADVSGDNRVTSLDALMILQAAAGAIEL